MGLFSKPTPEKQMKKADELYAKGKKPSLPKFTLSLPTPEFSRQWSKLPTTTKTAKECHWI